MNQNQLLPIQTRRINSAMKRRRNELTTYSHTESLNWLIKLQSAGLTSRNINRPSSVSSLSQRSTSRIDTDLYSFEDSSVFNMFHGQTVKPKRSSTQKNEAIPLPSTKKVKKLFQISKSEEKFPSNSNIPIALHPKLDINHLKPYSHVYSKLARSTTKNVAL